MDQKKAVQLLKDADSIDRFRSAVIASPVNTAARNSCQYTVWPEQEVHYAGPGKVIIMSPSAEGGSGRAGARLRLVLVPGAVVRRWAAAAAVLVT